ncbi:MAG: hypothetical protein ACRDBO_12650 [Lachnospiraceae bacterium]
MNFQCQNPLKRRHCVSVRPLWRIIAAAMILFGGLAFVVPESSVWAAGPSQPAAAAANEPVTLAVEYGYGGTAKGGRYLPVQVTVGNQREHELNATLQIKSLESDGTIYRYDYPVRVDALSQAENHYYIPLGSRADQLFFSLIESDGTVILNKKVKLNVSLDVPELFIGVLSDQPGTLQYLDGVGINYSTLRTRVFALEEEGFPEEEIGLNLLDVIVVNGYKLRNLSEKQTAAILDWVHSGGVLILGTGDRVDDTLGRFAPELLDDSYGTPEIREIDMGAEYATEVPEESILNIACVDIPLHGGNVIFSSGGFATLTAAAKVQGLIAVAAYDFADIAKFCDAQPSYVDKLFVGLLGEERINQLATVVYSGNSSRYWSVQSLINTGDVDKLPNLTVYTAVVGIYLLVLGPGLYLFLKQWDLQIFYRRGVVMFSLCFAVVIYLLGTSTRFRSTFYTYATIKDVTADYVMDTTYVNIRNPYNRPYIVDLNPEYSVLPITRSQTNETNEKKDFNIDEDFLIAISHQEDSTRITGQNIVAFDPRYFKLEKKDDNNEKVGITGEVDYFEGKLSGSITNQFSYPLENTCLILYGNMVIIDRLEAGETKSLDDLDLLRFPLNNSYAVAEWITGGGKYEQADIDDKEYLLAMERSNMLMFYLDSYMSGYSADARVIAFSTEKEERQYLQDTTAETYGLTMLTSSVAVNASRNRSLYRSVLMKKPNVVSGAYTAATNSMTGTEPVTLEYYLGNDIDVESLTFEPVSQEFLDAENSTYIEVFTGSIYFYNYTTGNYDLMDLNGKTLMVQQLEPYLSSANVMTVRYAYDGNGSYNAIQLPMPMVAGRER